VAHIIVVDDDHDVLTWLGSVLRKAGHDVVSAPSGIAALNILDGSHPLDLMVTDVVMPGLNGLNLACMARMRRPRMRVIYLTGYGEVDRSKLDVAVFYGKVLSKPITADTLAREVDDALGRSGCRPAPAL
jgi:two-component system cell cycle response regulator CpdR